MPAMAPTGKRASRARNLSRMTRKPSSPTGGIGIVFRRGREHAADAGIVDEIERRGVGLRDRLDRQTDDAVGPSSRRASAAAMSSWPTCTPSAPAASATSTRSLIRSGTPLPVSAALIARASLDHRARRRHACRATGTASHHRVRAYARDRAAAGRRRVPDREWHKGADLVSCPSSKAFFGLAKRGWRHGCCRRSDRRAGALDLAAAFDAELAFAPDHEQPRGDDDRGAGEHGNGPAFRRNTRKPSSDRPDHRRNNRTARSTRPARGGSSRSGKCARPPLMPLATSASDLRPGRHGPAERPASSRPATAQNSEK